MRPPFRAYLLGLTVALGALLLLVAGFNLLVDPYGIWHVAKIRGLNDDKPSEANNDMIAKAVAVEALQPRTVLLGSSRVDLGIDPRDPAFSGDGPIYNLALLGGTMHTTRRYFDHWLASTAKPKRAIVGLDFFAFNANLPPPPTFDEARLNGGTITIKDANLVLLSRTALDASVETVIANLEAAHHPRIRADGMLTDTEMRTLAEQHGMVDRFDTSLALYLNQPDHYADFTVSQQAFDDLRWIVEESRRRGIDLRVFVPPEHASLTEAMALRGLMCTFLDWKRRVAALTPFWDFSGFNGITTEPVAQTMKNYWDASHFRAGIGTLILDRMFGIPSPEMPADFGFRVTEETVAAWQDVTLARQADWESTHRSAIRWIAAQAHPPVTIKAATAASFCAPLGDRSASN